MLSKNYDSITIIYNPNSTGDSKKNALELVKALKKVGFTAKISATKSAGHAEELAYTYAKSSNHPLVVSSSGDGGYNEVINGLMRAQLEGASPTCGLLPSGNANDHYNALTDKSEMFELILKGQSKSIDVLVMNVDGKNGNWLRYAHSYIGLGVTADAGRELNKIKVNKLNEAWIVWKSLLNIRPVKVESSGKSVSYTSLIFSNINRMSKLFSFSSESSVTDGKFEVTKTYNQSSIRLINFIIRALHKKSDVTFDQVTSYAFTTKKTIPVQLDGEVCQLAQGDQVTITILPKALNCLV